MYLCRVNQLWLGYSAVSAMSSLSTNLRPFILFRALCKATCQKQIEHFGRYMVITYQDGLKVALAHLLDLSNFGFRVAQLSADCLLSILKELLV